MSHKRKEIREAVVQSLIDGATAAGTRVFNNRSLQLWETQMPAINVFGAEETNRASDIAANVKIRRFDIHVDCYFEAKAAELEDEIDEFTNVVEGLLASKSAFGADAIDAALLSTTIEHNQSGEKSSAKARMTFRVMY